MKFKLSILLIGFLFLFSCQEEMFEPELELETSEKSGIIYKEGAIVSTQITSRWLKNNLLGDPATRNVNIYLPKGYNQRGHKRYPVIYLLHGQPASETSLFHPEPFEVLKAIAGLQFSVDFPEEGFVQWINNLMETGQMKKCIIVMPNAANKFGLSYYTNSPTQGNYEQFITRELVWYIDRHYKTIPSPKARAVTGQCVGGYGALRLAIKYPSIFNHVAALTPLQFAPDGVKYCALLMKMEDLMFEYQGPTVPLNYNFPYKFVSNAIYGASAAWLPNPNNPPYFLDLPFTYASDGSPVLNDDLMEKWMEQELMGLVPEYQQRMQRLSTIYFDVGLYDELGLTPINIGLHQMMEELNIPHEFETYEGGHMSHLYSRLELALIDLSESISRSPRNTKHRARHR